MSIVSIKHNDIEFASLNGNGTIILNCAGKVITDTVSASITIEEYDGSYQTIAGDKPTNLTPSFTYTGSEITNGYNCPDSVTMTGSDRGTAVGIYTATYTLKSGYIWSDGTADSISVILTINRASVGNKPSELNPEYVYTGSIITNGYTTPSGVIMTGSNSGTAIGTYTATYIPDSNHCWSDSTINLVTVVLIIDYAMLRFVANSARSTISMQVVGTPSLNQNFWTSTDGTTWTTFTPGSTTITLTNVGDKIYFKGNNPNGISEGMLKGYWFKMTGSIASGGNVMSLIDNGACTTTQIPNNYCFYNLFYNCSALTNAPKLPATTLTEYCYTGMFQYTSITVAPVLPATTLAKNCYYLMFCSTQLTVPPRLPATTLSYGCYQNMFVDTPLTTMPELPATTLAANCYNSMFNGCTSLIVSDLAGTGYDKVIRIPTSGVLTGNQQYQFDMFTDCATGSSRSSNDMPGAVGQSYTYYTQNTPV